MPLSLHRSTSRPSHHLLRGVGVGLLWLLTSMIAPAFGAEQQAGIPDWAQILNSHRDRLAAVDSDQSATELFVTQLGPAVGLADAAGTIGAKGIPAKLSKELQLPDITRSAQRLVAALAAWQAAEHTLHAVGSHANGQTAPPAAPPSRIDWLNRQAVAPTLADLIKEDPPREPVTLALAAGRTALEASQQAAAEWWRLKTWKDRVRNFRGQARL